MPQDPGAPAPAQESAGGGIAEQFMALDEGLSKLSAMVAEVPEVPDEAKAGLAQALEIYRASVEQIMAAAGGGGGSQPAAQPQTPEQGGNPNVQPMSPAGVR